MTIQVCVYAFIPSTKTTSTFLPKKVDESESEDVFHLCVDLIYNQTILSKLTEFCTSRETERGKRHTTLVITHQTHAIKKKKKNLQHDLPA